MQSTALAQQLERSLPAGDPIAARLHRLADDTILAVWDSAERFGAAGLTPEIDGEAAARPYTILNLPTETGGIRAFAALRWPADGNAARTLAFVDSTGCVVAEARRSSAQAVTALDPAALLSDINRANRLRFLDLLLEFCRTALGLQNAPGFAGACRDLIESMAPPNARLDVEAELTPRLLLCRGALPAEFGAVTAVYVLAAGWVRRSWFVPALRAGTARNGLVPFHLVLDRAMAAGGVSVVLRSRSGIASRRIGNASGATRPLLAWLERRRSVSAELRDYLIQCLTSRAVTDPEAAAAAREMQLFVPIPRRRALATTKPVGGEIETALVCPTGGLFVSGWLRDPHGLVEALCTIPPSGKGQAIDALRHRFPRDEVEQQYRGDRQARDTGGLGFIAYASGEAESPPVHQHRFALHLKSGATIELVAPPPPTDLADARAAALGSMPGPFVTEQALESCIGPAAAALHAAYMATKREPEIVAFGVRPDSPTLSIVIPLYRNLEFLRFQIAAFAIDRQLRDAELVYVLDSPEQRGVLEHLLLGLHGLYGLPLTLVVMSGNFGFSSACNAGAAAARGSRLLFLNSDVIPDAPGWIGRLFDVLESDPAIGAVGPKLLFEDQSLQHAGMFFGRDLKGRWINQHFFKGFPRDFGPANRPRSVPAITGAAVLIRRELYESIGGFCEDYIIGDYEDSDLCLKIRRAGHDIWYVPAAELFHFERKSIERHAGYMRSVASQYNGWLHARRWDVAMRELMEHEAGGPMRGRASDEGAAP